MGPAFAFFNCVLNFVLCLCVVVSKEFFVNGEDEQEVRCPCSN
jgi:hypothetical protein